MSTKFDNCPTFKALDLRYKKFILKYLSHGNASKAAREAGYSAKTSRVQASQLLTKLNIQKALAEVNAVLKETDIATVEEIRIFWTRIMRGCITDVCRFTKDGLVFTSDSTEMDRDTARLIKKVKVTEKTSQKGDWTECKTEIELHDPLDASDKLARSYGIYKDKIEISGKTYEELLRERIEARKAQGKKVAA